MCPNFARTLETELAAAKAECDMHLTRLASIFWSGAIDKLTGGDIQKWAVDYTSELACLRAEVERLKTCGIVELAAVNSSVLEYCKHWEARAERAEAERNQLRAEVERLKTGGIVELAAINSSVLEYCKHWEARAERAEADLATERARLDWLMAGGMCLVQHSGGFHVSRLHCQVSRAAIDLGMKEDAK